MWTQSKIKDGDLKLQKVLGTNNVADAMTEAVISMDFGHVSGSDELHFDARSRGLRISCSIVQSIFMNSLVFISTEEV